MNNGIRTDILLVGLAALGLRPTPSAAVDFSRDSVGTTGSEFLLFDIGARGIGMGGAYTAMSDDAYSLYWNPAGLARVPRFSGGYTNTVHVADMSYQSASFAYRWNETVVLGGGWRYLDGGNIDSTDISGIKRGQFRPRSYVGEVGWGQTVYDLSDSEMELTVGATARWIHSAYLLHADGFGGDIGMQARFYSGPFLYDFAATVQNMGNGQNFVSVRDTLPFRFRIGGTIYPLRPLAISLEAVTPIANQPHGILGVEYSREFKKNLKGALRAGFNSMTVKSLGPLSTMSVGAGLKYSDLSFDYAFTSMGVLGSNGSHRFSFNYNLPSKSSKRYRER